jgi:uridine kinase/putative flippase GtrA
MDAGALRALFLGDDTKGQFSRFLVAGGVSTVVNYLIFAVLNLGFGMGYLVASAVGYVSGFVVGFVLNKRYTFKSGAGWKAEALKTFAVYGSSLVLNLSALAFLVKQAGMPPLHANVAAIGVSTIANFLGLKFISFRPLSKTLPRAFFSRAFLAALSLKIAASFLFGADVFVKGFVPFVSYFVGNPLSNPYDHFFYGSFVHNAFPYPPMMLLIAAVPRLALYSLLSPDWAVVGFLEAFSIKLALLAADLAIFFFLCKILKGSEQQVLNFYWLSPVLFYISYIHGQLDAIPVALLFASIFLLFRNNTMAAFSVLGFAVASKTTMAAVVPIYLIYLSKRQGLKSVAAHGLALAASYGAVLLPYVFSAGFQRMVLSAPEQGRIFELSVSFGDLVLYVVPIVYAVLLLRFFLFNFVTKRALLMFIALVFTAFVTLVPPAPGWYFWSLPFIAYFFVAENRFSPRLYWLLNAAILLFLLFSRASDFPQSFQLLFPAACSWPNAHAAIQSIAGAPAADLVSDLAFSGVFAAMAMAAWLIYKNGVRSRLLNLQQNTVIAIGIAGDSGSGKTTLANSLARLFAPNALVVCGDDMHRWERGDDNWKGLTHLNPLANKLHEDARQVVNLKRGYRVKRSFYDHSNGKFTEQNIIEPRKFMIFEGLHYLYTESLRNAFDIRIFLDPDPDLKLHWKLLRDVTIRKHSKKKVLAQVKNRQEDLAHHINPQREFADIVVSFKPRNPRHRLGDGGEGVKTVLEVECRNSLDLNAFAAAISSPALRCKLQPGLVTQKLEISGRASEQAISDAAGVLVPDHNELLLSEDPHWDSGYGGILQLLVLFQYQSLLEAGSP